MSNRIPISAIIKSPLPRKAKIPNRDQRKWLIERCHNHANRLNYGWRKTVDTEPARVTAARKIIKNWEKSQERKANSINAKIWEAFKWLKEQILFGETYRALALTKAWEKTDVNQAVHAIEILEDLPATEAPRLGHPTWDAVVSDELE